MYQYRTPHSKRVGKSTVCYLVSSMPLRHTQMSELQPLMRALQPLRTWNAPVYDSIAAITAIRESTAAVLGGSASVNAGRRGLNARTEGAKTGLRWSRRRGLNGVEEESKTGLKSDLWWRPMRGSRSESSIPGSTYARVSTSFTIEIRCVGIDVCMCACVGVGVGVCGYVGVYVCESGGV
eukprot:2627661-Rhodomonas_salina.2